MVPFLLFPFSLTLNPMPLVHVRSSFYRPFWTTLPRAHPPRTHKQPLVLQGRCLNGWKRRGMLPREKGRHQSGGVRAPRSSGVFLRLFGHSRNIFPPPHVQGPFKTAYGPLTRHALDLQLSLHRPRRRPARAPRGRRAPASAQTGARYTRGIPSLWHVDERCGYVLMDVMMVSYELINRSIRVIDGDCNLGGSYNYYFGSRKAIAAGSIHSFFDFCAAPLLVPFRKHARLLFVTSYGATIFYHKQEVARTARRCICRPTFLHPSARTSNAIPPSRCVRSEADGADECVAAFGAASRCALLCRLRRRPASFAG